MKPIRFIVILFVLLPLRAIAYDFEVAGIYYTIVSKRQGLVEVTHWEEKTDAYGKPQRLHHAPCACCHHDAADLKHVDHAIALDSLAAVREKTAYIGDVVVPVTVRYKGRTYRVAGVGGGAFYMRQSLRSVSLPDGIRYIGSQAFSGCRELRSVRLPMSLDSIGFAAFRRCSKLSRIELSDTIRSIGSYAFAFCSSLESVRWPLSAKVVPGNAFWSCPSLRTIYMPHLLPPEVLQTGLVNSFPGVTFHISPAALSRYKSDPYWQGKTISVSDR